MELPVLAAPCPMRFLRLPDGRAVRCVGFRFPVPIADHVGVTVTDLATGHAVDLLVPEAWQDMGAAALGAAITPAEAARAASAASRRADAAREAPS
jgi:hypothetical protein